MKTTDFIVIIFILFSSYIKLMKKSFKCLSMYKLVLIMKHNLKNQKTVFDVVRYFH